MVSMYHHRCTYLSFSYIFRYVILLSICNPNHKEQLKHTSRLSSPFEAVPHLYNLYLIQDWYHINSNYIIYQVDYIHFNAMNLPFTFHEF